MNAQNKPPTAFESWYAREGLAYDPYAKRAMQVAWNASRKAALEDASIFCHDAAASDPTLTARFCAHALKALK